MKSETDNAFEVQVDVIRVYDAYLSGTLTHTTKPVELSRMQLIELALSAEKERLALEQHVEIIQPKADAFDRIATSTGGALNLTNAAKSLQLRPHEFNQHLHLMRWIYKRAGGRSWIAYQDRLQEGVLEHKIYTYVAPDGTENIREQVLVTAQGLALLAKTLNPLATARRSNEQGGGRILARAKSNIGPDTGGFGYELAICEVAPGIETTRILWGNALEGSARDLLAAAEYQSDPNERNTTTEAMDWLREQLSHGAVKVADVQREARAAGISDKALRTARERLGIKSSRAAFQGGYQWAMPPLDERT
ncbi:hypothetical protein CKO12_13530 [Chromatium okenii]|nr:hypothetical protein [Chromatium okenii]